MKVMKFWNTTDKVEKQANTLVFSTSVAETFVLLKRFFKSPLKIKCI
jgi:hypothetical protein